MYLGYIVKVLFITAETGNLRLQLAPGNMNAFHFFSQLLSIAYGRIGSLKTMQMGYMYHFLLPAKVKFTGKRFLHHLFLSKFN